MDNAGNPAAVDRARYRVSELPAHHFASHGDDELGALASRAALSEVPWTPDVAASVADRLARDAAAYPEQFGPGNPAAQGVVPPRGLTRVEQRASTRPGWRSSRGLGLAMAGLVAAVVVVGTSIYVSGPDPSTFTDMSTAAAPDEPAVERDDAAPVAVSPQEPSVRPPVDAATDETAGVERPALLIVGTHPLRDGKLGARVRIDGLADADGETHRTQLQRKVRGGQWRPVVTVAGEGALEATLVPGKRYDFRVRALDEAGNVISARRVRLALSVRHWASKLVDRTPGDWTTTMGDPKLGGALASKSSDAAITTSFSGAGIALVAPTGPTGGAMNIRVDGGDWELGDLSGTEPAERAVVFSRHVENGAHSIDITVGGGVITLDSVLIVRMPQEWPRRA